MKRFFHYPFVGCLFTLLPSLTHAQTIILDTFTSSTLVQQENIAVGMAGSPTQAAYAVPGVVVAPPADSRVTSLTCVVMINSTRTPQDVGFAVYRGSLSEWQATPNPVNLQSWVGNIQGTSLLGTAGVSRFWQVNMTFTDPTFTLAGGASSYLGLTGLVTSGDVALALAQELSLPSAPSIHWRSRKFTAGNNQFDLYGQGSASAIPYRYHPVLIQGVGIINAPEPGTLTLVLLGVCVLTRRARRGR
jgi:hypothetical protein